MTYRLDPFRPPIVASFDKAEAEFVASLRRGYRSAWGMVRDTLPAPRVRKSAGDLRDNAVLTQIRQQIEAAFDEGALKAAMALTTAENAWFASNAASFTPIETAQLLAKFREQFASVGGFKTIADNATDKILSTLANYYGDYSMSLTDLEAQLRPWFSAEKAYQVGVTETTRMGTANALLIAEQTGATEFEFDDSNDILVCSECSDEAAGSPYSLGDAVDYPPLHVNCVIGSTRVSANHVTGVTERLFDGRLVIIETAGGRQLSCTENHPILTPRGWVAAGLLDEGCDVICGASSQGPSLREQDEDDAPATIEQVARAFRRQRRVFATEVPVAAPDFHGDGFGSQIAVVATNGLLRDSSNATVRKHLRKHRFSLADVYRVLLMRQRAQAVLGFGGLAATGSGVGGLAVAPVLFGRATGHHEPVRLCQPAPLHARFQQHATNYIAAAAEGTGQGLLRFSRQIAGDHTVGRQLTAQLGTDTGILCDDHDASSREVAGDGASGQAVALSNDGLGVTAAVVVDHVASKRRIDFHGHVFNLQTRSGRYGANGIITHNCRCRLALLLPDGTIIDEVEGD